VTINNIKKTLFVEEIELPQQTQVEEEEDDEEESIRINNTFKGSPELNYIKKLTRINHQICQIKFHLSHN
jgi:hypothetical protein